MTGQTFLAATMIVVSAAALAVVLIMLLRPLLVRYALARPNVRSSHTMPTPQGGGIAVIASVCIVALLCDLVGLFETRATWLMPAIAAMLALGATGALDDIRPLPVLPRLLLQFAAAALLVLQLPADARVLSILPTVIERALLVIGLVWFINLTNFMDGIDLMTVVEVVPIALALAFLGLTKLTPGLFSAVPLALALAGALIGFAPYNRHIACLFLGDVGSLPIGALLGFLLILLAAQGELAAAFILPLYYLADASVTLVRRWRRGEQLSQAHRSHFYQLATQRGFTVPAVDAYVLALNSGLAILAIAGVMLRSTLLDVLAVAVAALATAYVLMTFERGRQ
jgi:UDP-N-acetylmuramyl pentapeptide phosphotransferase/UDP-N-acetylglucosamine-1-phosphate transferase